MRIFRANIKTNEFKGTELYSNATMQDWNKLMQKCTAKAERYGKMQLPCVYPESNMAFSVRLNNGKLYRFWRTAK